ncbi:hypothetical protein JZX87_03415 [Agrobacterium sp. Ap1]|uniref:hypothetical protein n=1 Tax=Agrobacterium sp. Ap1 TaxID=2815337 RepID=UPI001A8E6E27|nr:hypothetical protein [Agrobacterium sp. Ap1]MBO0140215.1 hypothetical protein [Agrobacterium sp. Ap1]
MTDHPANIDARVARSTAVARAVANLGDKLGYDADIVFEGAVRGAAALMLARGATPADVAKLLESSGRLIGTLDQNN